jgi:signal transduction histidine kinase
MMRAELIGTRSDGTHFHADVALSPLNDGNRRLVICSIRDVSLYRQAEESLRVALAHEKELNELQGSFTTIVSHEFRTPLAVILSSTEILLNYSERLDEQRRKEKLINITRQITRLMHLLNDVLLITRGEHRGFEFNPAPVRLDVLCSQTIDEVMAGNEREIHIDAVYQGECQLVNADEFLFSHILQNLITNAIKYSNDGGTVHIMLTCSKTSVTLQVKDHGIGIPEKHHANLFEPFRRGSNVGQIKGTGIGLSIVKRAVESHGGTIEFESIEGVGTTFVVSLPVVPELSSTMT